MRNHSAQSNERVLGTFRKDLSKSCPGITVKLVEKYIPNSVSTEK